MNFRALPTAVAVDIVAVGDVAVGDAAVDDVAFKDVAQGAVAVRRAPVIMLSLAWAVRAAVSVVALSAVA